MGRQLPANRALAAALHLTAIGECRLSLAHFSPAFKASVGITLHAWLQASRINTAKELLQQPALSHAEIAVRCGFADQSHFKRTFKRVTGLTPGACRRSRA